MQVRKNKDKLIEKKNKLILMTGLQQGVELRPPGWKPGIVATRLLRFKVSLTMEAKNSLFKYINISIQF